MGERPPAKLNALLVRERVSSAGALPTKLAVQGPHLPAPADPHRS
ncbi:MAG: hypothetical protein QOJ46_2390 [bacterium]|jgi:hypothetical protein